MILSNEIYFGLLNRIHGTESALWRERTSRSAQDLKSVSLVHDGRLSKDYDTHMQTPASESIQSVTTDL